MQAEAKEYGKARMDMADSAAEELIRHQGEGRELAVGPPLRHRRELIEALQEFQRRYNDPWLIEQHGYRSPAQVRHNLTAPIPAVA
jgi:hypothetical protein